MPVSVVSGVTFTIELHDHVPPDSVPAEYVARLFPS
jgi:hypothetical protein